jgi:DNA-directed RNA polymerase specialized sigma24 family protein
MAEDSFERFYTATYHRLLRQLAVVTGDRGDAEAVLQEAYGRAALRWERLADYEAPEAWGGGSPCTWPLTEPGGPAGGR